MKLINNQALLFIIFSLNGVTIGLLFDFFRILRKSFKTSNLITYFQDILFWVLTGIIIIIFMYNFSNGSIRLFMFIGLILGLLLYLLTISKFIIKLFVIIINSCKKIVLTIFRLISIPFTLMNNFLNKIVFRIVYIITKHIDKNKFKYKNVKKNTIQKGF